MSRPRLLRRAVLAVLAVLAALLGFAAPAAPAPALGESAAVTARADASPTDRPAAHAAFGGHRGPACAPGAPDLGDVPGLPARAGAGHGLPPVARALPAGVRTGGETPVRALVRGPDRPVPGPVELSVMRV
ncbi:hypothetical protein [Streptomyces sp. NPDC054787]